MICVTFRFRLYLGTQPMVHVQMICRMGGHFFHQMLLVRLVPVPAGNIQITWTSMIATFQGNLPFQLWKRLRKHTDIWIYIQLQLLNMNNMDALLLFFFDLHIVPSSQLRLQKKPTPHNEDGPMTFCAPMLAINHFMTILWQCVHQLIMIFPISTIWQFPMMQLGSQNIFYVRCWQGWSWHHIVQLSAVSILLVQLLHSWDQHCVFPWECRSHSVITQCTSTQSCLNSDFEKLKRDLFCVYVLFRNDLIDNPSDVVDFLMPSIYILGSFNVSSRNGMKQVPTNWRTTPMDHVVALATLQISLFLQSMPCYPS